MMRTECEDSTCTITFRGPSEGTRLKKDINQMQCSHLNIGDVSQYCKQICNA